MKKLAKEIIKIESQISNEDTYKDNINFYEFISKYETDILKIKNILLIEKKYFIKIYCHK